MNLELKRWLPLLLAALMTASAFAQTKDLPSPDGKYTIRLIPKPMPGANPLLEPFTIALSRGSDAIDKESITGILLTAFWSADGQYVAVNNRTGNSGDYVWIFALPSEKLVKRPEDTIGTQWQRGFVKR